MKDDMSGPKPEWRTLEELAGDPSFRERLYNEFPSEVEAITDPVARRTFLKLMGASLALAAARAAFARVISRRRSSAEGIRPEPEATVSSSARVRATS